MCVLKVPVKVWDCCNSFLLPNHYSTLLKICNKLGTTHRGSTRKSTFGSVGSGSEFFGFGYCLEDKLRVRVSSGLNISVKFGFGFELSGLSGFTGLKMLKVQFFDLIFQLLPKVFSNFKTRMVKFKKFG